MRPLVYATRRSVLALAQCRAFVEQLRGHAPSLPLTELQLVTSGDRIQDKPLADWGGKGLFVKEIEEALLEERADFAVHSVKDVPGALPPGLMLACIPQREDPRDALIAPGARTLGALRAGARVGTSSLRRAAALKECRPDIEVVALRGNVDSRLRRVASGEYDAIVVALAGLVRLGLSDRATEVLDVDISLPAVGQGALGIECRQEDSETRTVLAPLHDPTTATCVAAERGVLVALGGDCRTPLGAYAERQNESLRIRAFLAQATGPLRRAEAMVAWPASESDAHTVGLGVGRRLA